MTIRIGDLLSLAVRGANLCGNDDIVVFQCEKCRHFALYNTEILTLYLDPDDLSKSVLYIEGNVVACPYCNAIDSFDTAPDSERKAFAKSSWGWVSIRS